jgi:hypothetical protein
MKSIAERWTEFERRVIASDAPQIQRDEMRLAFYAGCATLIDVENEVASVDDDAVCVIMLDTIYQEVWKFGSLYGETGGHCNA